MRWAGDSELDVFVVEEVELSVLAQAFDIAPVVVVAADLGEVLSVEGDGEVVEEHADVTGGLVAEFVGHEEVGQVRQVMAAAPRRRARGARR